MDFIGRRRRNFILLGDDAETHVNELGNAVASYTLNQSGVPVLLVVTLHSCSLPDLSVSDVPGHRSTLN